MATTTKNDPGKIARMKYGATCCECGVKFEPGTIMHIRVMAATNHRKQVTCKSCIEDIRNVTDRWFGVQR
jgi:RNase P subunit RPR2